MGIASKHGREAKQLQTDHKQASITAQSLGFILSLLRFKVSWLRVDIFPDFGENAITQRTVR